MSNLHLTLQLLFFATFIHAGARPLPEGRVSMQGAIVDAACTIETDNPAQVIDSGIPPLPGLLRDGPFMPTPFAIRLRSCTLQHADPALPGYQAFHIAFEGVKDGEDFGTRENDRGVALRIADTHGRPVIPGVPVLPGDLHARGMRLDYTLTPVVRPGGGISAGAYYATARFRLDYF